MKLSIKDINYIKDYFGILETADFGPWASYWSAYNRTPRQILNIVDLLLVRILP